MTTDPTPLIRCITCGYVLGTNLDCGTCQADRYAGRLARKEDDE